MDIQKIKELALANGFKLKEQADGSMDLNAYVYDFANAIEQAAKAQAVPETQQSKQAEIDDLNAQLKAVHDSRIEFVEYCRKIESGDFVIVDKTDLELAIDALKDASNNDDDSFAHRAKDLEKALKNG